MNPLPPSLETSLASRDVAAILAATIAHFGCQAGTVHLIRDAMLRLAAHQGIPAHIAQIVETVPVGKGIAGLAAERRAPVSLCNLQIDASGQARPAAKATGMEGSLAVPMLVGGEVRGVLGIAKPTAYDWNEDETALLLEIAARMASAGEFEA